MTHKFLESFVVFIAHVPRLRWIYYRLFLYWPDWPKPLISLLRAAYWSVFLKLLGARSRISYQVKISAPSKISIGKDTHVTNRVILDGRGGLRIGDDVLVGFESIIITLTHNYLNPDIPIRLQGFYSKPVAIGNDVWLGTRVIVLPGVTLGDGAVIGSGAVITRDIPAYAIAAGVPVKVINKRESNP